MFTNIWLRYKGLTRLDHYYEGEKNAPHHNNNVHLKAHNPGIFHMLSTTWRFNVSAHFFPRAASDHQLVFVSIAAVTLALGVRVVDMTSSGRAGHKYV